MAVPTWIPVSVTLPRDSKALSLDIKLGMERTWSYVAELWFEAAKHHQDGRIEGPHAAALVARRAGWPHDPDKFVRAMVEARWLDETPDGYRIHDWDKHTGAHIKRLDEEKEKVREWREKKKAEREAARNAERTSSVPPPSPERNADVTGNVPVTYPDEREMEMESETLLIRGVGRPVTPLVAFLRETYPDIRDPWKVEAAWAKAYPRIDLLAEAIKARAWEVANPTKAKKHHASFLNRWYANATGRLPPVVSRTHGDLGSEIHPWPLRLTEAEVRAYREERLAIAPSLADAPIGIVGPERELVDLNAKWRAIAEERA